jgi:lantibiotic modifying enzyme
VREAARSLNAGWLEEAEVPDVMDGVAGALLGLLTVHSLRPDHEILAHALAAGEHLLRARVEAGVGSCAWRAQGGSLRAGFSHGAAGIAYALLRLHRLTNDERFRVAAQEAIAYEESLFDGGAGNWPSVPPPAAAPPAEGEEDRLMIAWCNGASGIGLARLGGLSSLDTPLVRRDLAAALETTERALGDPRPPADHVCCGTMGRIELLVCAAQRLSQPDRLTTARRACRRLLGEVGGGLRTGLSLPYGVSSPGFFQGIAGVGYQARRLVDPQRLPSVLLWQ